MCSSVLHHVASIRTAFNDLLRKRRMHFCPDNIIGSITYVYVVDSNNSISSLLETTSCLCKLGHQAEAYRRARMHAGMYAGIQAGMQTGIHVEYRHTGRQACMHVIMQASGQAGRQSDWRTCRPT